MKKRIIAAAALLVVAVGVAPAPLASAGQGCVTRAEFRRLDEGMRQARVRGIFGTSGERIQNGPHREEYAYDICPGLHGVVVFVTYRNNQVISKSWILGE